MIRKMMVNRIIVGYVILFSLNSLAAVMVAALMNTQWSSLTGTERFLLFMVIIQNWTGTMLAFVNRTMSQHDETKNIFPVINQPKVEEPV